MVHIYLCLARALSAHLGRFLFPSLSSPLTTVPAPGEDTEELPLWLNLTPKIWGWLPQGTGLGFLFYLHCQTQQNCTRANASNTELLEHRHISVSAHKCTGLPSPPQDSKGAVLGGDPTAAAPSRLEGLCHGPHGAQKSHTTWMGSVAKPKWLPTFPFTLSTLTPGPCCAQHPLGGWVGGWSSLQGLMQQPLLPTQHAWWKRWSSPYSLPSLPIFVLWKIPAPRDN